MFDLKFGPMVVWNEISFDRINSVNKRIQWICHNTIEHYISKYISHILFRKCCYAKKDILIKKKKNKK